MAKKNNNRVFKGTFLRTDNTLFPCDGISYGEEAYICLGSLKIRVRHIDRRSVELTMNCGLEALDTQEGLLKIKLGGYTRKLLDFESTEQYIVNKKHKIGATQKYDLEDGFNGYKKVVCGLRNGTKRSVPDAMLKIIDGEQEIYPKFVEYAKKQGMLWGYIEVYENFINWHLKSGVLRANFYAAWQDWVRRQKEFNPKYFQINPHELKENRRKDNLKDLMEFEQILREKAGNNA